MMMTMPSLLLFKSLLSSRCCSSLILLLFITQHIIGISCLSTSLVSKKNFILKSTFSASLSAAAEANYYNYNYNVPLLSTSRNHELHSQVDDDIDGEFNEIKEDYDEAEIEGGNKVKAKKINVQEEQEPLKTIEGGPSEIFSMARRMMVWNEDFGYPSASSSSLPSSSPSSSSTSSSSSSSPNSKTTSNKPLPRWHPHEGIADANPSFRHKPPMMNNKGYAKLIRRNSRKRNKQSLWRHAYRTYNNMKSIEENQKEEMNQNNGNGKISSKIVIMRHTVHYEAALVSCAKLGLWREALNIYNEVVDHMEYQKNMKIGNISSKLSYVQTVDNTMVRKFTPKIVVTDNMILSIVSACVRGSKAKFDQFDHPQGHNKNQEYDRREPLDAAKEILLSMEVKFNLPLVSRHVNKLASAYHHIALHMEGNALINETLNDRKTQAQDKEDEDAVASFNVNDVKAKDGASYNILIQGAVEEGDWASAIASLKQMTDKGLYPESRSLNRWSETAQRRERRAGSRKTTWKKNRERLITGTLPVSIDATKSVE